MGKASRELSVDYNNNRVGSHGGTKVSTDINNKHSNRMDHVVDEDHDGIPEKNVSKELSEASAKLTNYGSPDKGLFSSSEG